jgi:hypothetical protein
LGSGAMQTSPTRPMPVSQTRPIGQPPSTQATPHRPLPPPTSGSHDGPGWPGASVHVPETALLHVAWQVPV